MDKAVFAVSGSACRYLTERDPRLGAVISRIGPVERQIIPDLFSALVHAIVGQQISGKAQASIWKRVLDLLGYPLLPGNVLSLDEPALRACGLSARKVGYIREAARRIETGALDLAGLSSIEDEACIGELLALPGVGRWTAEMLLIFSMKRPDVFSIADLGIQRGIRMLYRIERVSAEFARTLAALYSPYATTASFYLWELSGGACPDMDDPAKS
ncbi:MAG: DNA-3-methyladenine glycosylase 2 family protein [Desulfovibrio sp.]|nr:DNA-3-methyladenine glycosylase 2 family protein [Desulfovibrio sp.]